MAAATVASNRSMEQTYISRVTIQLKLPPRIYEWRTQVAGVGKEANEAPVECIRHNGSTSAAPPTPARPAAKTTRTPSPMKVPKNTSMYTPPLIYGDEAKQKNLLHTLRNFYDVERFHSDCNRVTK
ncbi:uncharacterized protein LOC132783726 [Drosophila nasuta]|uniref:uncharacterized protein LOC132783726 n=1 Tax=Drosophila nasuta TaxID=42062 RepID=UPI00295ED26A|nr:uncharacterized protein LOC132783726 [Drosophila nasuta]